MSLSENESEKSRSCSQVIENRRESIREFYCFIIIHGLSIFEQSSRKYARETPFSVLASQSHTSILSTMSKSAPNISLSATPVPYKMAYVEPLGSVADVENVQRPGHTHTAADLTAVLHTCSASQVCALRSITIQLSSSL